MSGTWPERVVLSARRFRNRLCPPGWLWRAALCSELKFWRSYFATRGLGEKGYDRRLDPDADLEEAAVLRALDELAPRTLPFRVLDVGSGPITSLGRKYRGERLDIVALDCLADEYNRLLKEFGIQPPVPAIQCQSEHLLGIVEKDSCDVVFARNAIDHCQDPIRSIFNMLEVAKKNCFVVLKHGLNEAEQANYQGLHQWNFSLEQGRLVLWRPGARWDLTAELKGRAEVESLWEGNWLVATIRKV